MKSEQPIRDVAGIKEWFLQGFAVHQHPNATRLLGNEEAPAAIAGMGDEERPIETTRYPCQLCMFCASVCAT